MYCVVVVVTSMTVQKKVSVIVDKLPRKEFVSITALSNSKTITSCINCGYYGFNEFENKKALSAIILGKMVINRGKLTDYTPSPRKEPAQHAPLSLPLCSTRGATGLYILRVVAVGELDERFDEEVGKPSSKRRRRPQDYQSER